MEQFRHQGNDVRLGDRLPESGRQRPVVVGVSLLVIGHEDFPRNRPKGGEDPDIVDIPGGDLFVDHPGPV